MKKTKKTKPKAKKQRVSVEVNTSAIARKAVREAAEHEVAVRLERSAEAFVKRQIGPMTVELERVMRERMEKDLRVAVKRAFESEWKAIVKKIEVSIFVG